MERKTIESTLGEPPEHLGDDLARIWCELLAAIPANATVAASDRLTFELLTRLVSRLRTGDLAAAETAQVRALLTEFGLSPLGRQQIKWARSIEP